MSDLKFGVCRLSVVPVRAEPSDKAEQVTQLLFGDHYHVLEESTNRKWFKIRVFFDQYEGWIDHLQTHQISSEYFHYLNQAEFKITTDITSTLLFNKVPLTILLGSIIPISSSELFKMEEQYAFNGDAKNVGLKREFEFIRNIALKYLNTPYLWGGKTPFGIDCSGFVQMAFRIGGYTLPRDAWQQAKQGKPVQSLEESRPGDLAFFTNSEGRIVHVGIVLSENKIIHASGKVRVDGLTLQGIVNSDSKELTHTLSHLRRILTEV
jgi:gamma-D-glutamyl-L-lysine dipeptidyl-peptidase